MDINFLLFEQFDMLTGLLGLEEFHKRFPVILTDKVDLDVIDMQDRLRLAFPGLLEIRRETVRQADYTRHAAVEKTLNPFELCCQFLNDADEEEKEILQDIINTVQGVTK